MQKNSISSLFSGAAFIVLRLFLAYEFLDAGLEKWNGQNWFAEIQSQFPFPFNLFSAELNWNVAMFAEIIVPILLVIGLFTRFSALSLIILTAVAWYSVHSGNGYNISQGGYKMALIYLVVLFPLLAQGAGVFSIDFLMQKKYPTKKWLKFI